MKNLKPGEDEIERILNNTSSKSAWVK